MAKIHIAGMEGQEKFDVKTFDPWKTAAKKGENISFIDVWLAESPATKEEMEDAQREVEHLTKIAQETGSDLYRGFERELAEIQSKPYDEVVKEQKSNIELTEDTYHKAPRAAKPTSFFPDF